MGYPNSQQLLNSTMTMHKFVLITIWSHIIIGQRTIPLVLNQGLEAASRFSGEAGLALSASLLSLSDIGKIAQENRAPAARNIVDTAARVVGAALPPLQARAQQLSIRRGGDLDDRVEDAFKVSRDAARIAFLVSTAATRANELLNDLAAAQVAAATAAQRRATIAAQNALIAYKYVDQLEDAVEEGRIPPAPPIFL